MHEIVKVNILTCTVVPNVLAGLCQELLLQYLLGNITFVELNAGS